MVDFDAPCLRFLAKPEFPDFDPFLKLQFNSKSERATDLPLDPKGST